MGAVTTAARQRRWSVCVCVCRCRRAVRRRAGGRVRAVAARARVRGGRRRTELRLIEVVGTSNPRLSSGCMSASAEPSMSVTKTTPASACTVSAVFSGSRMHSMISGMKPVMSLLVTVAHALCQAGGASAGHVSGRRQREASAGRVSVSGRVATAARAEWRRIEGEVVGYLGSVSEVSRHLHLGAVVELGPGRHACVAKQQKSSNGVECGCNTVECSRRVIWSARWHRRQVCSRQACRAGCRRAAPRST